MALMSEAAAETCPDSAIAVLSGPTFASEVAAGLPTAVTLACADQALAERLAARIALPHFRPYTSTDVIGDSAAYLQDGMAVMLSTHEGVPIAIELPARVVLEIVDTEPSVKGQTASSSYKPAMLSNGLRTMVPPYLTTGTRVVILTEDGSYVERAKD